MNSHKTLSLNERCALAMEGRKNGYNCAQSVVAAFPDVLSLPLDVALRLTCGFGAGFGGLQKMCGVVSAMTLLEGIKCENGVMGKAGVYKVVRDLSNEFKDACGSLDCADLKSPESGMSCNEVIIKGVEIFHNYLNSK